ncbi:MAG TPA: lipid-binding SYLF domain-containing protein, partial [Opitutus sp.]|nr:lipid-binding SYLF domain-containing protein [Opitutus sp.]
VVPHYGAGAFIAGASGGEGILLAHNGTGWSDPVFYNLGKVSVGLQAGVSAGSIAMVLLTDEAVNSFRKHNNFSLTADAGLSVVTWSRRAQADLGRGHDVIVWSDTAGLLGNVSVGVADIWLDRSENEAYYGQPVNAPQVLNGEVSGARANNRLLDALNNL